MQDNTQLTNKSSVNCGCKVKSVRVYIYIFKVIADFKKEIRFCHLLYKKFLCFLCLEYMTGKVKGEKKMKFCHNLYDGAKHTRTNPFISYGSEEWRADMKSLVSSLMTELRLSWFQILILKCTVCLKTSQWIILKLFNGEKTLVCIRGIKQILEKKQKERKRKEWKIVRNPHIQ